MSGALSSFITPKPSEMVVFDQVDTAVATALEADDPHVLASAGKKLRVNEVVTELAQAKLLSEAKYIWPQLSEAEPWDEFLAGEIQLEVGTVNNYVRAWRYIFENEDLQPYHARLAGWGITLLVDICAMANDGRLDGHWENLMKCTNRSEVREYIRELKGHKKPENLKLFVDRTGTITTRFGEGEFLNVGFLDVESEEPDVQKAIDRIREGTGMIER